MSALRYEDERLGPWLEMLDMGLTPLQRMMLCSCLDRYDFRQFGVFVRDWGVRRSSTVDRAAQMYEKMAEMHDRGAIDP